MGRGADEAEVVLLPFTRSALQVGVPAIELPLRVKEYLGLDAARSWVLLNECNIDGWPSPDLAALPGKSGQFAYGFLPPRLFRQIRDGFVAEARAKRVAVTRRGQ